MAGVNMGMAEPAVLRIVDSPFDSDNDEPVDSYVERLRQAAADAQAAADRVQNIIDTEIFAVQSSATSSPLSSFLASPVLGFISSRGTSTQPLEASAPVLASQSLQASNSGPFKPRFSHVNHGSFNTLEQQTKIPQPSVEQEKMTERQSIPSPFRKFEDCLKQTGYSEDSFQSERSSSINALKYCATGTSKISSQPSDNQIVTAEPDKQILREDRTEDFPGNESRADVSESSSLQINDYVSSDARRIESLRRLAISFSSAIRPVVEKALMLFEGKLPRETLMSITAICANETLLESVRVPTSQDDEREMLALFKETTAKNIHDSINRKIIEDSKLRAVSTKSAHRVSPLNSSKMRRTTSSIDLATKPYAKQSNILVLNRQSLSNATKSVSASALTFGRSRQSPASVSKNVRTPTKGPKLIRWKLIQPKPCNSSLLRTQQVASPPSTVQKPRTRNRSPVLSQPHHSQSTALSKRSLGSERLPCNHATAHHLQHNRDSGLALESPQLDPNMPRRPPCHPQYRGSPDVSDLPTFSDDEDIRPATNARQPAHYTPRSSATQTIRSQHDCGFALNSGPARFPLRNSAVGIQIEPQASDTIHYQVASRTHSRAALLRARELGYGRFGKWGGTSLDFRGINRELKLLASHNLRWWRTWTGTSKDVLTAIWAPNGFTFAVGCSAEMDELNIQYNRQNNLLLGNLDSNTLKELPDHRIPRPRPEIIQRGDNSRQDTYNALDPHLYTTVSDICFDNESKHMYSASFDRTVKVWDVTYGRQPSCLRTLPHQASVDLLSISSYSRVLASGQKTHENSIGVYDLSSFTDDTPQIYLSSERAKRCDIYPSALQWGKISKTNHLLLAGFTDLKCEKMNQNREGDLCLWDVEANKSMRLQPTAQAVFDLCWHPSLPIFAAATTPRHRNSLSDRFSTRSVIRLFQPLHMQNRTMELECQAYDINNVRFHPFDTNYISVGCTDGATYIWDLRKEDEVLHKLCHDKPIDEPNVQAAREEDDTGVRMTLWDEAGVNFYTGSSDGCIKRWNIFGAPEDVFVGDVVQFDSSIMTGAFSPDYTNLLIGLSKGSVEILSTAPWTHRQGNNDERNSQSPAKAYEQISYIPAVLPPAENEVSGIEIAQAALSSGELVMHPIFGAGKGDGYKGPYARWARVNPDAEPEVTALLPDVRAMQLDAMERKKGFRHGGKVDATEVKRRREQDRLARERNFLRYHFREANRPAKKRDVEGLVVVDDSKGKMKAPTSVVRTKIGGRGEDDWWRGWEWWEDMESYLGSEDEESVVILEEGLQEGREKEKEKRQDEMRRQGRMAAAPVVIDLTGDD